MSSDNCQSGSLFVSTCTNSGSQIDIGASITSPSAENQPGPSRPSEPVVDDGLPDYCFSELCRGGYTAWMLPEVTAADLVSFRPATPSLGGEPEGFGVAGLPTNLVASASDQTLTGSLLGYDVQVRFVPAGYVFDHGDGTSARSTTGGAHWTRLGLPQFSPTDTSHVYGARGTYTVGVTVQYAAYVDFGFGAGWRPVRGFVTADSGGYGIRVVEASTALVDQTCLENPTGPGC